MKDLPKVPQWRLEWDSNLQPSRRKAPNLPLYGNEPIKFLLAVITVSLPHHLAFLPVVVLHFKLHVSIIEVFCHIVIGFNILRKLKTFSIFIRYARYNVCATWTVLFQHSPCRNFFSTACILVIKAINIINCGVKLSDFRSSQKLDVGTFLGYEDLLTFYFSWYIPTCSVIFFRLEEICQLPL